MGEVATIGSMTSLRKSMKLLLNSGDYSDLKITCNGKEWNVHKAIVCSQCEFFKAATRFGGKETIDDVIDLPDDDPVAIDHMIQFMYKASYRLPSDSDIATIKPIWMRPTWKTWPCDSDGKPLGLPFSSRRETDLICWTLYTSYGQEPDYKNPKSCTTFVINMYNHYPDWQKHPDDFPLPANHRDASMHAHVYSLADKYNLPALKTMAAMKFNTSLGNMYSGSDFFDAVKVAFTTTPDTDDRLRNIVVKHLHQEKKLYGVFEELEEGMKTIPGLAYRVWKDEQALPDEEEREKRPVEKVQVSKFSTWMTVLKSIVFVV